MFPLIYVILCISFLDLIHVDGRRAAFCYYCFNDERCKDPILNTTVLDTDRCRDYIVSETSFPLLLDSTKGKLNNNISLSSFHNTSMKSARASLDDMICLKLKDAYGNFARMCSFKKLYGKDVCKAYEDAGIETCSSCNLDFCNSSVPLEKTTMILFISLVTAFSFLLCW